MKSACFGWVILYALLATSGCRTPSPEWNGTWKLNPSQGNFQGPILTISTSGDGEYRYDDGSSSFSFRCDGKDRAIRNNRTLACLRSTDTVLDLTQEENGTKTNGYHWALSADGKVFTSTATAFRPGGATVIGQVVASRISGSRDFSGQWQDGSFLQRHANMTLTVDSRTLHISYPNAGQYIDAPLNGVDAAVYGPHAPRGMTFSVGTVRRREILALTKHDGKAVTQESLELSSDGRTLIDSWWSPDRPKDKGVFVYEKK